MAGDKVLTPDLMYRAAVVVALLDAGFASLLWWRIGTAGLRRAKWPIAIAAALFWFALWVWAHGAFWDRVYSHVFPAWARWVVPPVYGAGFAGLGLGWRWVALRAGRWAVPAWVALWAVTGALTHTYAIFGRGLLEKAPMLQRLTPASAIVFATCEFGFYGCVMLAVAAQLQQILDRRRGVAAPLRHGPAL